MSSARQKSAVKMSPREILDREIGSVAAGRALDVLFIAGYTIERKQIGRPSMKEVVSLIEELADLEERAVKR